MPIGFSEWLKQTNVCTTIKRLKLLGKKIFFLLFTIPILILSKSSKNGTVVLPFVLP